MRLVEVLKQVMCLSPGVVITVYGAWNVATMPAESERKGHHKAQQQQSDRGHTGVLLFGAMDVPSTTDLNQNASIQSRR
jgi:hypothetical protein